MDTVSPNKAGLVLAAVLGGWHAIWASLVAIGWAQAIINFVFWLHMIKPVYVIGEFRLGIALLLVGFTAAVGYIVGAALAAVWNALHRRPSPLVAQTAGTLKPAPR